MPSIPGNLDWFFLVIGGLLALGSLYLLFWSLFRDRARAEFHCPKCWYDLTKPEGAAPTLPITCSECGWQAARPRDLHKRRRRWRYALLALILFLAAWTVACYPDIHRRGWVMLIPTWVLIDAMPIYGYPSPVTDEIATRFGCVPGHMSPHRVNTPTSLGPLRSSSSGMWGRPTGAAGSVSFLTHAYLAHRVAKGNLFARPISPEWQNSLGAFHEEFHFCLFDLGFDGNPARSGGIQNPIVAAAVREMYDLPVDVQFRTRPAWPEGVPLYVEVNTQNWWPFPSGQSLRVQCTDAPTWYEIYLPECFILDHALAQGPGSLTLDVRVICRRQSEPNAQPAEQGRHAAQVPYRIEGTIDEILPPVSDPAIDALVSAISVYGGGGSWGFHAASTQTAITDRIAFGVLIEYCMDGIPQSIQRMWWIGGTPSPRSASRGFDWEWLEDPRLIPPRDQRRSSSSDAKPGENWTVRIRSDPETALRVIDADRYWQGDVTIPLTIR